MNTNVTISDEQMAQIKKIAEQTGVAADDLVREAIDRMIVERAPKTGDWKEATRAIYGIWKDRNDLEDTFKSFRDGFEDRHAKLFPEA
ncbi:hypothetical protein [Rhizobium sp.]